MKGEEEKRWKEEEEEEREELRSAPSVWFSLQQVGSD